MPGTRPIGGWKDDLVGLDDDVVFLWTPGTPFTERRALFSGATQPISSIAKSTIFVNDGEQQLHVIDLESESSERLAEDVAQLRRPSPDGRFVLALIGDDDPYTLVLIDRQTKTEHTITKHGSFGPPFRMPIGPTEGVHWSATEGLFVASDDSTEETLLISYPDLEVSRLPGLWDVVSAHLERKELFLRHDGSTYRISPPDGGLVHVADFSAEFVHVDEQVAYLVAGDERGDRRPTTPPFQLYRVSLRDSAPPKRLLEGIGLPLPLGDHRWAYTRAYEGENLGDLMLFDAATEETTQVARDVALFHDTARFTLWTERNALGEVTDMLFTTSPPDRRVTLWHYAVPEG